MKLHCAECKTRRSFRLGNTGELICETCGCWRDAPERKKMTTEEMARKCFCDLCSYGPCTIFNPCRNAWKKFARAARRFVRMENKQAMKRVLKVCNEIDKENLKRRVHINYDTKTAMKLKRKSKSNPAKGVR